MRDINEKDAYIKSAENAIRSLIEQIRSNPSNLAALIGSLQALLSVEGLDQSLIEAAIQVLAEASEKAKSASMSGGFGTETPELTNGQKKLIADFYVSLEDLKEEMHQYSETLEKIKKHNAELESLNLIIESTPLSQNATDARARQGTLILEMIDTLTKLTHHNTTYETRLEQCHARRRDIEQDGTFSVEQKNAFFSQAEKEVQEVENELRNLKAQGKEYDAKVAEHFERAMLDMVAVTYCNTLQSAIEQDYRQVLNDGLSGETKKDVHEFIQKIKDIPLEQRHGQYEGFMNKFVNSKIAELSATDVMKSIESKVDNEIIDDPFAAPTIESVDKKNSFAESIQKQREDNKEQPLSR